MPDHNISLWLTRAGLVVGVLGTILLFFWNPPPSTREGVGSIVVEDANTLEDGRSAGEHRKDQRAQAKESRTMSRFGLGLIAIGFLCQLVATYYA